MNNKFIDSSIILGGELTGIISPDKRAISQNLSYSTMMKPIALMVAFSVTGAVLPADSHRDLSILKYNLSNGVNSRSTRSILSAGAVVETHAAPLYGMSDDDLLSEGPSLNIATKSIEEREVIRATRRRERKSNVQE